MVVALTVATFGLLSLSCSSTTNRDPSLAWSVQYPAEERSKGNEAARESARHAFQHTERRGIAGGVSRGDGIGVKRACSDCGVRGREFQCQHKGTQGGGAMETGRRRCRPRISPALAAEAFPGRDAATWDCPCSKSLGEERRSQGGRSLSSAAAPGESAAGTRCAHAHLLLCRGGAKVTAPPSTPTARRAPEGLGTDGKGGDGGLYAKGIPLGPRVRSTASVPSGDEAGGPQGGTSEGEPQKDREVMREVREARLEKDFEEHGMSADDKEARDSAGIMVAMATAAEPQSGGDSKSWPQQPRLWLEMAESMVAGCYLSMLPLRPVWHVLRAIFGLSLLFYGQEFPTLAFHIVVFRLSGWKKAAKSRDDLIAYYQRARQAMNKAAADVRRSAVAINRKNKHKARLEVMMAEKKRLHRMGRVSVEDARAFIDKYRKEIEIVAREQEVLAAASNSVLALKGALSYKKLTASLNSLYAALVTSITASTFKRPGQLTLALTCGGLIKRTLFDLLGPIIDPIGYQIELETYVAKAMRGPANLYITMVGYLGSAALFFHFMVEPHDALKVTFVLLGARAVTDYIVSALNPVRSKFGMTKKMDNMPSSAVIYLTLVVLGYGLHQDAGLIGDYVCKPFIALLRQLNKLLNQFQISTITYFS